VRRDRPADDVAQGVLLVMGQFILSGCRVGCGMDIIYGASGAVVWVAGWCGIGIDEYFLESTAKGWEATMERSVLMLRRMMSSRAVCESARSGVRARGVSDTWGIRMRWASACGEWDTWQRSIGDPERRGKCGNVDCGGARTTTVRLVGNTRRRDGLASVRCLAHGMLAKRCRW
jgi:hypothetical protein